MKIIGIIPARMAASRFPGKPLHPILGRPMIERVVAGHFLENPASGKVLRANGFVETGEIRPVSCLARGGELVLSRRYEKELVAASEDLPAKAA